ncbi:MAG TPA: PAS domain S-box protein [Steroidobacteraceae bacterium]|nr:PAS domain S-box protein [Steroidobacteraceae bacterium]
MNKDGAISSLARPMTARLGLDADTLRLLIDSTTDYAIFLLDPQGNVQSWNAGAQRMQGYEPHEIIGKHFSTFYPDEAKARNWPAQELEFAARDGRFEDEGWRVRKDGTLFWANVVITALRDQTGRLVGFGKVSRDLSERRRAEQQMRESEERFRLMVENTLDYAIFMLDPDGNVASWNAGAQRIKGYKADEIIGKHFSTFYPQEAVDRGWPQEELRRAIKGGRFEDEGWRVRKDGSMFWANVVITALFLPDGTLRGFAKVTRDMSQRRAHEQRIVNLSHELEQRVAELGKANRELAQQSSENESFVYSVSHDLRAPLVNLQGFSHELLLTSQALEKVLADTRLPDDIQQHAKELLSGELHESISFIQNAVRHLGNIIDGLLRLSRVGRVEYKSEPIDLNKLLNDILASLHSQIVQSGGQVKVHPLPVLSGDRNAVGQIFANIVGNALKSFARERPGVIDISATDDEVPVISIRDNGVGIPADYHNKIFRVFQHVHSARNRGEGMGLAIVRRIVDRHGGRIWFESNPDTGTTFYFTLGPRLQSHHSSTSE